MDGEHFDGLVKRLTEVRLTRWAAVRGLLASAAVGLTGASLANDTAAKKPGGRKSNTRKPQPPTGRPGPCTADGGACQQNRDCCGGNCFGQVCTPKPSTCSGQTCPAGATGCCAGDGCCQPPNNQCNTTGGQPGLCCAPNCNGRQCGDDGCGNTGACGSCLPGQTCSATGKCQGQPTCSSATCPDGCCANNTCQPGNTDQACGTGGAPCANCPGSKSTCQDGVCVALGNTFTCLCNNGDSPTRCDTTNCGAAGVKAICPRLCANLGGWAILGNVAQCQPNSCVA